MITNACELEKGELIDAQSIKGTPVDENSIGDGKVLAYNQVNDKLEYVEQSGGSGGASTFLDLTDSPNTYIGQSGKVVSVKSTEDGLEFSEIPTPTVEFIELTDTPSSYLDKELTLVRVSESGTALEFVRPSDSRLFNTTTVTISSIDTTNYKLVGTGLANEKLANVIGTLVIGSTSGSMGVIQSVQDANTIVLARDSKINNFVTGETLKLYDKEVRFACQLEEFPFPTDDDITEGKVLARKSDGGFEYVKKITYLTDLFDTPTSYLGNAGYILRVNSTENGIEFVDKVSEEVDRLRAISRVEQPITDVAGGIVVKTEVIKEIQNISIANGEVTIINGGTYNFTADLNVGSESGQEILLEIWAETYDTNTMAWVQIDDSAKFNTIEVNSTLSISYDNILTVPSGFKIRIKARTQTGTLNLHSVLLSNGVVVPSATTNIHMIDAIVLGEGGGTGVSTFKALSDTPISYISEGGKFVKVKSDESGLEFVSVSIPTKTSDLINDSNFVSDVNYVHTDNNYTDSEKTKLAGIETEAEVNNISDTNATALTGLGSTALHYHTADRDRANHTGTQTASTISDFDTEVSNNPSVVANTSKVSFPEAPADGKQYARQDNGWSEVSGGGSGGGVLVSYLPITTSSVTIVDFAQSDILTGISLRPSSPVHGTSIRLMKYDENTYNVQVEVILLLDSTFIIPSLGATFSLEINMGTGTTLDYQNGETFNTTYNRSSVTDESGVIQGVSLVLDGGKLRCTCRVPKGWGGSTVGDIFPLTNPSLFFNHTFNIK